MADSPDQTDEPRGPASDAGTSAGGFDYLSGVGLAITGVFVVATVAIAGVAVGNITDEPTGPVRAAEELESYRNDQTVRLANYRWIDERAQLVTVPIEVAKDVIVKRGVAPIEVDVPDADETAMDSDQAAKPTQDQEAADDAETPAEDAEGEPDESVQEEPTDE